MTFDPKKPVQTRDGRSVRILCTDRKRSDSYSIVALVLYEDGVEVIHSYKEDGSIMANSSHALDLLNVPKRTYKYVNVYENRCGVHLNKETADRFKNDSSSGMVRLIYEDGVLIGCELVKEGEDSEG